MPIPRKHVLRFYDAPNKAHIETCLTEIAKVSKAKFTCLEINLGPVSEAVLEFKNIADVFTFTSNPQMRSIYQKFIHKEGFKAVLSRKAENKC